MDSHVVKRFASLLAKLDRLDEFCALIVLLRGVYRQGLITAEELEEEVMCETPFKVGLAFVLF